MVMSDAALDLVLQKWAWAKGEEAAMKLGKTIRLFYMLSEYTVQYLTT